MQPSLWYAGDVASAVSTCKERQSVLVVLIEPKESILTPAADRQESPSDIYARGSTSALHRLTFSSPLVSNAVHESGATCLRLRDGLSQDFINFCAVFVVPNARPALFMIGPNGRVLVLELGFVSPKSFVSLLRFAQNAVRNPALSDTAASTAAALIAASRGATGALSETSAHANPATTPALARPVSSSATEVESRHASRAAPVVRVGNQEGQGLKQTPQVSAVPEGGSRDIRRNEDIHPQIGSGGGGSPRAVNARIGSEETNLPSGMRLRDASLNRNAKLAVRLLNGLVVRKSFVGSDCFGRVRAWVAEEAQLDPSHFALSVAFPRRFFDSGEDAKMLSELMLCPSESLVVTSVPQENTASAFGLGTASNVMWSAVRAAGSVAGRLTSWLPSISGTTVGSTGATDDGSRQAYRNNASSMREIRRSESTSQDRNQYYNGNGTQFGGDDEDTRAEQR